MESKFRQTPSPSPLLHPHSVPARGHGAGLGTWGGLGHTELVGGHWDGLGMYK